MNLENCNVHDLKELWEVLFDILVCDNIWQRAAKQACMTHIKIDVLFQWGNSYGGRKRPYSDFTPMKVDVVKNIDNLEIRKIDEELRRQYHLLDSVNLGVHSLLRTLISVIAREAKRSISHEDKFSGDLDQSVFRVWCLLSSKDVQGSNYAITGLSDEQHKAFDQLVVEKLFASITIKHGRANKN